MPAQWLKRIRRTGQLTFFNKASGWIVPIEAAVKSFNTLSLGVQVVAERTEKAAVGLMFPDMQEQGGGLIEYLPEKGAKPMPPIRLGSKTVCKAKMLWSGGEACQDD
jgi:hypothetical protein